jgi:hypothetical protein
MAKLSKAGSRSLTTSAKMGMLVMRAPQRMIFPARDFFAPGTAASDPVFVLICAA